MQNEILKKEEDFHDGWASSINLDEVMVDEFFEACTSPENKLIMEKLGDVRGKKILELGCGAGEASVYFAKKGATVTATDISNGMLKVVDDLAARHGVSLETRQCYSHTIPFQDGKFDIVYAANLLHHIDLEPTLREIKRVLKTGGIFVGWDPLAHNPLINIYRRKAKLVRTDDEHPIRINQLDLFRENFSEFEYKATWFFTLWIFLKFYLVDRIDPNKERYWKKILIDHKKLEKTYSKLEKVDKTLLRFFPFFRKYCWNIIIFAIK